MAPRKMNPIAEKLMQLIWSGKHITIPASKVKLSKELICVLTDLKYPTLENVFSRTEVSYATLKSLKFALLITDKEEADYRKWVLENAPKRKPKKKGGLDVAENTVDHDDESEDQGNWDSRIDESESQHSNEPDGSNGVLSEE